jgi:dihydropteroate synthase
MIVTPRPQFAWRLATRSLTLGANTRIIGILNVTPDSFSDGGRFFSHQAAVEHGLQLLEEGADILDVGGESTRPGSRPAVTAGEEMDRVLPVIEQLHRERPGCLISIDTYKADVARQAVAVGAAIVNDVSGFLWDSNMAQTCAELGCGVILMHTRGTMAEWKSLPPLPHDTLVSQVARELQAQVQTALAAGIARDHVVLDPGFGFGKRGAENFVLLSGFNALHALGYPLLAGLSRKSFLASPPENSSVPVRAATSRLAATLAATTAAILAGAHIVRVHDVRACREAAATADAIRQAAAG